MLGSRIGLPFLSGLRRIEGGYGMPVIKVINIPVPGKKGSAKPKSTKKGDDFSEACLDVIPFESGLPLIGNIFLRSIPPPSAHTRPSMCPTTSKS